MNLYQENYTIVAEVPNESTEDMTFKMLLENIKVIKISTILFALNIYCIKNLVDMDFVLSQI